jgi:hypothetical protein
VTADDIFEVARIAPSGADTVYPLVSMLHPGATPDGWAAFVREHSQDGAKPCGVFALRDGRGVPHGLFTFAVTQGIDGGATLDISELATLRLPGTHLVDALLHFANRLAAELDLPRIAISLERSAVWLQDHDALQRSGFQIDRVMVLRRATLDSAA